MPPKPGGPQGKKPYRDNNREKQGEDEADSANTSKATASLDQKPRSDDVKPKGSGKPRQNKQRRPSKDAGSSDPKPPNPIAAKAGISALTQGLVAELNIGLSGYKQDIEMKPLTNGYMQLVDQCYTQIISAVSQSTIRLTRAQWRHCHRLMFAKRLEDIRFDMRGIKPPAAVRAPIPKPVRVFQPIWDALACIGTVVHEETSAAYVPIHPLPNSDDPDKWDADYVVDLMTCSAFDWPASWAEAKENLFRNDEGDPVSLSRAEAQSEIEDSHADSHSPAEIKDLINKFRDLKKRLDEQQRLHNKKGKTAILKIDESGYLLKLDDSDPTSEVWTQIGDEVFWDPDIPLTMKDVMEGIRKQKKERQTWKPRPAEDIPAVQFDYEGEGDTGAYGAYLGWNPQLWINYNSFVEVTSSICLYSLSMPNESTGSMAWVCQWYYLAGKDFCKLPTRSIPPADWVLAILLRYASFEAYERRQYISTWFTETDALGSRELVIIKWIQKAIKMASPVIPTYL